jgi:hypothetical protein
MTDLVVRDFNEWARGQGLGPARAEIRVERLGIPHAPVALPEGWQGVYCFKYQEAWLKVGKAGPKSGARWTSHHYHPGRAPSTLAFSLLRFGHFSKLDFPGIPDLNNQLQGIDADHLGDWIKQHTERVNFLIRSELGPSDLDRLERIAHGILKPIFEGNWDPQGWKTISRLTRTGADGAEE